MTTHSGTPVAIVLAVGGSTELGPGRLFETIGGQAVVERVIHALLHSPKINDVVIVIPPGRKEDFTWLRSVRVHLVENPHPEQGRISSIRVALRTTWVSGRAFLICPADVPFLPTEVVNRVVQTFLARPCRIVIPSYKGLRGHPHMFASSLADDFFLHGDEKGTQEILRRHQGETVRLNVHDPDICFDIGVAQDLKIADDASARWARVERDAEVSRKIRLG